MTKRLAFLIAVLAAFLLIPVCSVAAAENGGITVAVFDFKSKDASMDKTGELVAELVRVQMAQESDLRLVSREDIQKTLEELKMGLAGITDEAAPKVGKLLGAQVLVVGKVFDVNGELSITAKAIGVETSRVYSELVKGDASKVSDLGQQMGEKIAKMIAKGRDTLLAKETPKEDQMKELKSKIGKDRLPRVYVHVAEQVAGRQIVDPAAQMEIQWTLKQIGCQVVKDQSGVLKKWADDYISAGGNTAAPNVDSVDLILIGSAVSQFASRTGDLVSSRARLELEALAPRTGNVLAVDRQTQVAVDLAEEISAKSALQKAASEISYRIIPEAIEAWRGLAKQSSDGSSKDAKSALK